MSRICIASATRHPEDLETIIAAVAAAALASICLPEVVMREAGEPVDERWEQCRGVAPMIREYLRRFIHDRSEREKAFLALEVDLFIAIASREDDGGDRLRLVHDEALLLLKKFSAEHRRSKRRLRTALDEVDSFADPPAVEAGGSRREAAWEWEAVALAHLPPAQRAALEWHEMDDLTDREIARRLDYSEKSIRTLRERAKRVIHELLREGKLPAPPSEVMDD